MVKTMPEVAGFVSVRENLQSYGIPGLENQGFKSSNGYKP